MITKDNLQFKTRENTSDDFIVSEVTSYFKWLNLNSEDIVLDIGAHIGSFSIRASKLCKKVYCFEPENNNYNLLIENIKLNSIENIIPSNFAVVGNQDTERRIYLNGLKNTGSHSLLPIRGRGVGTIKCIEINSILNDTTKIKMDCEGSELEIVSAIKDWKNIKIIVLECHLARIKESGYQKILEILKNNFTTISNYGGNNLFKTKVIGATK